MVALCSCQRTSSHHSVGSPTLCWGCQLQIFRTVKKFSRLAWEKKVIEPIKNREPVLICHNAVKPSVPAHTHTQHTTRLALAVSSCRIQACPTTCLFIGAQYITSIIWALLAVPLQSIDCSTSAKKTKRRYIISNTFQLSFSHLNAPADMRGEESAPASRPPVHKRGPELLAPAL